VPGIPHLSGVQSFNNDLFRTGTADSAAAAGNAAATDKAPANAVQAPPEAGRGQRGADPDGDDADIRREQARIEAQGRPDVRRAERGGEVVDIGDRREAARDAQADLFANPFRRPRDAASAPRPAEDSPRRPVPRASFIVAEPETPSPRLRDVRG